MNVARLVVITLVFASAPAIGAGMWRPKANPCSYNCPPPVGSISAPAHVAVPASGRGSASIRWSWDQSRRQPVAEYSCLWVSGAGESVARIVQCEHPGHTYTLNIPWIGIGMQTFRVAPGNPNGPYTRPISVLQTVAQATVIGVAQ